MSMTRLTASAALVVCTSGCASWFLNGAEMAERDYAAESRADYAVAGCKNVTDGSLLEGPQATYHVVNAKTGPALFERSPDGSGALITNRWAAADGTHYFTWVQSNGWEYVVPENAATAQRIAYTGLATAKAADGTTRPSSAPAATCELKRTK